MTNILAKVFKVCREKIMSFQKHKSENSFLKCSLPAGSLKVELFLASSHFAG